MKKQVLAVACISAATFTAFSISSAKYEMNLGFGARGRDVEKLQKFLIKKQYLEGTATGYFGRMTREAVRKYQKDEGLERVGRVGPETRKHLDMDDDDNEGIENEDDDDRNEHNNPRATSTVPVVTPTTGTSTGSTSSKTVSSSVNFNTPGGANTLRVTVTGTNGVISNITYSEVANDSVSQSYYNSFKAALNTSSLVGKTASSISLSRVGGASLTTNAFVSAVRAAGAQI